MIKAGYRLFKTINSVQIGKILFLRKSRPVRRINRSSPVSSEQYNITMASTPTPEQLKAVFNHFDKNKSGTLDFDELKELLKGDGSKLTQTQIKVAFTFFDGPNGDKEITFDEFVNGMSKMDNLKETMTEAFKECDKDNSGALNKEEAKEVILKVFSDMPADEIESIFVDADKDGDGKISLEEFLAAST